MFIDLVDNVDEDLYDDISDFDEDLWEDVVESPESGDVEDWELLGMSDSYLESRCSVLDLKWKEGADDYLSNRVNYTGA